MEIKKVFIAGLLIFVSSVGSSCSYAKKDDISKLRAEVRETRQVADQAMATANESIEISRNTEKISRNTEEIVNRSFKRSMLK